MQCEELSTAALFIGFAFVLDMLDGRIARMTGTTSAFGGIRLAGRRDLLWVAPAILSFKWGLEPLGQIGWAAGFLFVAAAAVRLARFNIQAATQDKRYFVGLPSPAAWRCPRLRCLRIRRASRTCGSVARAEHGHRARAPHGEHDSISQLQDARSSIASELSSPLPRAVGLAALASSPRFLLLAMAYTYLASAFIGLAWHRLRRRPPQKEESEELVAERR